jgi:DNA-binding NarL/FixJ family response regulator
MIDTANKQRDTAMSERIHILVCEDHPLMLEAIEDRLAWEDSLPHPVTVTGCRTAELAIEKALAHPPDIILMDLRLENGMSGYQAIPLLKRQLPQVRLIVYSGEVVEGALLAKLMRDRIDGYIHKMSEPTLLIAAIQKVYAGGSFFDPKIERQLIALLRETPLDVSPDTLSPRELQTLTLFAEGRTFEQVAHELQLNRSTVRTHLRRGMDKLRIDSTHDLILYCQRHGIIPLR